MELCPVCGNALRTSIQSHPRRDASWIDCPNCGRALLSRSLIACLPGIIQRGSDAPAKLSHAIRQSTSKSNETPFTTHDADAILENPLPRPREQADLLIRWLAENSMGPGETVWIEPSTHSAIIGAKSPAGFGLVVDHLFSSGLVTGVQADTLDTPGRAHAALTFAGWDHYESLRIGRESYRKAFMAMKFGDATLEAVVAEVFKPAAKAAGFELLKLNDSPRAGLIDDRLRVEIQASDFVIADLTHDNLGAYWEAGYAEGLGKPVIYTCERTKFEESKTHFDTNHHLTVIWDMENPHLAGEELKATIRATLPLLAQKVE